MVRVEVYINGSIERYITEEPISLFEFDRRLDGRSGQYMNEGRITFWGYDNSRDNARQGEKIFVSLSPQNCPLVTFGEVEYD